MIAIQKQAFELVQKERDRQDAKWGEQNHFVDRWTGIIGEEFGELCEAINETVFDNGPKARKKGGMVNIMTEASHVAATAIGLIECLIRNCPECNPGGNPHA